jgi:hypothetical protein
LHLTGTPSFVIDESTRDGINGQVLIGAQPLAAFESVMSKALEQKYAEKKTLEQKARAGQKPAGWLISLKKAAPLKHDVNAWFRWNLPFTISMVCDVYWPIPVLHETLIKEFANRRESPQSGSIGFQPG